MLPHLFGVLPVAAGGMLYQIRGGDTHSCTYIS